MTDPITIILNDKAVETLEEDALDFTPYVEALAEIIVTGSTPLTIGVFGTWGSGKTSLMRMVKQQVQAKQAVAGWFDAWKYDKEEALWRAFLLSVLFAVREATPSGEPTEDLDYLETMLYRAIDLEKAGGVTIDLAKLVPTLAQGAVQIGLSFIPGGAALSELLKKLQEMGAENLTENAFDAIQRERSKIHIEQVRFLEQFQDKFRELVKQRIINNGGRLVVFVDDLDRCLPEKAIEVLEAIKLFVDAPGCIFVLGLDQEVIARGVEIRYHDYFKNTGGNPIDGAKYLQKIIQLPFQIPPIEQSDMGDFVGGLAQQWPHPDCPTVFAEGLGDNPRQIKRTINVFLMLWSLAEKRKAKLQGAVKPVRLAKVVALQTVAPVLYEVLKEQPGLMRDLENYYFAQTAAAEETSETDKQAYLAIYAPELPEELTRLITGIPAIRRILTIKHADNTETSFSTLSPAELRIYFTLTKRTETPQSVVVEPAPLLFEPQMIRIPAGKFLIGSTPEQAGQAMKDGSNLDWVEREKPQHTVELSEYSIGKYPITNAQYKAFVDDTKTRAPQSWDGENYPPEKSDHPVIYVSWNNVQAYCEWLSLKTGKAYRLPSEAEWEYAARGTDGRVYPWGDSFNPEKTNTAEANIGDTTPVGQFSQAGGDSPFGCADMAGNVWEWCADWFNENEYKNRPAEGAKNPIGQRTSSYRVLRGGAFYNFRANVRCAYRRRLNPEHFSNEPGLGFRVALTPVSPGTES